MAKLRYKRAASPPRFLISGGLQHGFTQGMALPLGVRSLRSHTNCPSSILFICTVALLGLIHGHHISDLSFPTCFSPAILPPPPNALGDFDHVNDTYQIFFSRNQQRKWGKLISRMKYRSGLMSLMQLILPLPKRTRQLNFNSSFLK